MLILGDIHGDFSHLKKLTKGPIIQVGDFGAFPGYDKFDVICQTGFKVPVHFCDGNHENHEYLFSLKDNEIANNVFYQPRGSTLTLPNGRVALFVGGAASIDKHLRTPGYDWFPEEVISDYIPLPDTRVDIVFSHTCPSELAPLMISLSKFKVDCPDPTQKFLSIVLEKYQPLEWYFGHWHLSARGNLDKTAWRALDIFETTSIV